MGRKATFTAELGWLNYMPRIKMKVGRGKGGNSIEGIVHNVYRGLRVSPIRCPPFLGVLVCGVGFSARTITPSERLGAS